MGGPTFATLHFHSDDMAASPTGVFMCCCGAGGVVVLMCALRCVFWVELQVGEEGRARGCWPLKPTKYTDALTAALQSIGRGSQA